MDKTLTMDNSRLQKVELQTDVYMVCLQHALSTENFEVMGLLIGNVCVNILMLDIYIILHTIGDMTKASIISILVCMRSGKNISRYHFATFR